MPDPEQRRQQAVALAKELMEFERPMPTFQYFLTSLIGHHVRT
jgi:hypothetical protein